MKKIFNLKSFWIVLLFAAIAIFVFGVNSKRVYRSETIILVIPKSEAAAQNSDQIVGNLSRIPTMLSFYARMTEDNADVADDTISELPDYKKKAYWNSELQIVRVGTSGVLKFIATDSDRYRAETISSQSAASLIGVVGLYYDIKNDVDVRIIDPVITDYTNNTFNWMLFAESLIGFFLLETAIFFIGIALWEKRQSLQISRPKFFFPYGKAEASLPVEKETETALPLEKEWSVEDKPYTDFVNRNKMSSAPANLPVAEEDSIPETERETPQAETPITREATAEEVKARLNKLLSGKI